MHPYRYLWLNTIYSRNGARTSLGPMFLLSTGEWILRHYPCSGKTDIKGVLMSGLMQGYYAKKAAVIAKAHQG